MATSFLVSFIVWLFVLILGTVVLEFFFCNIFNIKKTVSERLSLYLYIFVVSCILALASIYRHHLQFVFNYSHRYHELILIILLIVLWLFGGILYKFIYYIMRKFINH